MALMVAIRELGITKYELSVAFAESVRPKVTHSATNKISDMKPQIILFIIFLLLMNESQGGFLGGIILAEEL